MPASKARPGARENYRAKQAEKQATEQEPKVSETARTRREGTMARIPGSRNWVPYVAVPVGLAGVLWVVTFNLASSYIPFMAALGGWNIAIAMGLIILSLILFTMWK